MQNPLIWQDEVRNPANTYSVTKNSDGTVTSMPAGKLIQQGTNQSAANFNKLSDGAYEANLLAATLLEEVVNHQRKIKDLDGQVIDVTLTNTLDYPFNNSKKTIAINPKDTLEYRVYVEIQGNIANVGDVIITDKQVNGFKIAYTGSAKSVKIRCFVTGGMCFYG